MEKRQRGQVFRGAGSDYSAVVLTSYIGMKQLFILAHLVVIVIVVNNLLTVQENWKICPVYAVPWKL